MQIAGFSSAYSFASPISAAVPRPIESASSPDLARASFAPVAAGAETDSSKAPTSQEEQDKPQDSSADGAATGQPGEPRTAQEEQKLQLVISELANRDREVRAHEQAHASVGGAYAGAPTYTFKRGPDGKSYAVGGEVGIDTSPIPGDPEATLRKMELVQRAALAPAEPSAQDLRVAAEAAAQATQARAELGELRREEAVAAAEERATRREEQLAEEEEKAASEEEEKPQQAATPPRLDLYLRLAQLQAPLPAIDLQV